MLEIRGTEAPIPEPDVGALFADVCRRESGSPALFCDGTVLTFGELSARAAATAGRIRASVPVRPGVTRVGMLTGRGPSMVAATFATFHLGAVHVPLDPSYPDERLREICADVGLGALVVDEGLRERGTAFLDPSVPRIAPAVRAVPGTDPGPGAGPGPGDRPAYVMYTSGSTGRPKGVEVPVRGLVNYLGAARAAVGLAPGDVYVHTSSVAFSSSIRHLVVPLLNGVPVTIATEAERLRPASYLGMLRATGATVLDVVPSFLRSLLDFLEREPADRSGELAGNLLRTLVIGSEPVPYALIDRFRSYFPQVRDVVAVLGGTELSGVVAAHRVHPDEPRPTPTVPIGTPMRNSTFHVLPGRDGSADEDPAVGELYVSGPALANRYLDEHATRERFLTGEEAGVPDRDRLYRTGDLVRVLGDGRTLAHLGRVDRQVKIRGMRVETQEVEAQAARYPGVRQAAVLPRTVRGVTALVAYLVTDGAVTATDLRAALLERLPAYMVPEHVVTLDRFPATGNGKLDVARLPEPARPAAAPSADATGDPEDRLRALWRSVLGADPDGPDDDFFRAGGSSLLAGELVSAVERELAVPAVPVRFFAEPTFGNLLRFVRDGRMEGGVVAEARRDAAAALPTGTPTTTSPLGDVLVTGANGFLGVHLLDEILARRPGRVHLVVRPRDGARAGERVLRTAERYGIDLSHQSHRLIVHTGDLGEPRLGLSEPEWGLLAERVEAIYHCGARVNHLLGYRSLRPVNVRGTVELVRLATAERSKEIHFVSTRTVSRTETAPAADPPAVDGYVLSKWVSEQLLVRAARAGVPVTVYRPGNITGDSVNGRSNHRDNRSLMLVRACIEDGVAPDWERHVEMVPVNRVAAAVAALSLLPGDRPRFYNLSNPSVMTWREYMDRVRGLGHDIRMAPVRDWVRDHVRTAAPGSALHPLTAFYADAGQLEGPDPFFTVDTAATQRDLRAVGLGYPVEDYDHLTALYTDALAPASGG